MARYITGIVGGLFIAFAAFFLTGLLLGRVFEGQGAIDRLVGFWIPALCGLLAGLHTFCRCVWPKPKPGTDHETDTP